MGNLPKNSKVRGLTAPFSGCIYQIQLLLVSRGLTQTLISVSFFSGNTPWRTITGRMWNCSRPHIPVFPGRPERTSGHSFAGKLEVTSDALTSDVPTFPYTAEVIVRFINLLQLGKGALYFVYSI
jgi:hypothetical protein